MILQFSFRKLGTNQIADFFRLLCEFKANINVTDSHPIYGEAERYHPWISWPDAFVSGLITFPDCNQAYKFLDFVHERCPNIFIQPTAPLKEVES